MIHIYLASAGIIAAIVFLGILQTGTNKKVLDNAMKTMADVKKAMAQPATSDPGPQVIERLTSLERRQEVLEADCKRYLAKANTRLRRAQELNGEEEMDEEEETPPQYPQMPLPFPDQNGQAASTEDSQADPLDVVRNRISMMR